MFYDLIAKSEYLKRYRLSELAMIAIEFASLGMMKEDVCNVSELYESALYDGPAASER